MLPGPAAASFSDPITALSMKCWPMSQMGQPAHDLAQLLQCLIGFALLAQDHKIVGIGHDTTAEALLQSELLPSQYKPAHVYIRQQR